MTPEERAAKLVRVDCYDLFLVGERSETHEPLARHRTETEAHRRCEQIRAAIATAIREAEAEARRKAIGEAAGLLRGLAKSAYQSGDIIGSDALTSALSDLRSLLEKTP